MAYIPTCCKNQCRKTGEDAKDENGYPYIYCRLTKELCIAQRWCPEQQKHIISERARNICKKYDE